MVMGRSRTRTPGRVEYRIGDRRRCADDADLADALDAQRVEMSLALVDENHLDVVHVGIHRHMIFGEVVVDGAAVTVVDHRLLVQRHADAADHGAHDLAPGGLRD